MAGIAARAAERFPRALDAGAIRPLLRDDEPPGCAARDRAALRRGGRYRLGEFVQHRLARARPTAAGCPRVLRVNAASELPDDLAGRGSVVTAGGVGAGMARRRTCSPTLAPRNGLEVVTTVEEDEYFRRLPNCVTCSARYRLPPRSHSASCPMTRAGRRGPNGARSSHARPRGSRRIGCRVAVDKREARRRAALDDLVDRVALEEFTVAHGSPDLPPVAIVIAAYHEEGHIADVMGGCRSEICGLGAAAIVVIDGDEDGTRAIVARGGPVRVILRP